MRCYRGSLGNYWMMSSWWYPLSPETVLQWYILIHLIPACNHFPDDWTISFLIQISRLNILNTNCMENICGTFFHQQLPIKISHLKMVVWLAGQLLGPCRHWVYTGRGHLYHVYVARTLCPIGKCPPTQVHPAGIMIRGVSAEIKIRLRGAHEKFADPPPLFFKWNSP